MSAEASRELVRTLVAAAARPEARPADLEGILADAGYPDPAALVTRLPASRYGADLTFPTGAEVPLAQLEADLGRARTTRSLDDDGPAERYWDVAVEKAEHVVVVAELDEAGTTATGVRLTPYRLD